MTELIDLPNLGKIVVRQLERVGITTAAHLASAGSVGAALRLEGAGIPVCQSRLCALEGAIRGIRWHSIPAEERKRLWETFEAHRPRL